MIDFSLEDHQKSIVDTAREFGREVLGPAEAKLDKMGDADAMFSEPLFWDALNQAFGLGFHKMGLLEMFGGLGLDPLTIGMVWEELGRHAPGYTATLIAGSVVPQMVAIFASGNKRLLDRYVTPFCEEDDARKISAWGSSEPNVGSDGKNYYDLNVHHSTSAVAKEDRWIINGGKSNFISNGGIADALVIFACVNPEKGLCGSGAFVVPADAPGVTKSKALDRVGLRVLNQAPVFFDDVEIEQDNLIFPPGEHYPMLHNTIVTVGNLSTGYLALGLLRAAYEEALEYSKERVQWGKPIFEHQLIAKKLHDAYTAIETARGFLQRGSWYSKTKFPGDLKTSLSAKIYATNMAARHIPEMVQVLGGYGVSTDYSLEKYMRDASLLQIMDGSNDTLMVKAAALL